MECFASGFVKVFSERGRQQIHGSVDGFSTGNENSCSSGSVGGCSTGTGDNTDHEELGSSEAQHQQEPRFCLEGIDWSAGWELACWMLTEWRLMSCMLAGRNEGWLLTCRMVASGLKTSCWILVDWELWLRGCGGRCEPGVSRKSVTHTGRELI